MKPLVIIPTYNEKDNIGRILHAIRGLGISELEVLVVDDSSPDATARVVQAQARRPGLPIHLMVRKTKDGLGRAYVAGFEWALSRNFDWIVSMDADFSHDPNDIPRLLETAKDYDVVIASRYVSGGKIIGWNWKRQFNSRLANWVTRRALGLSPKDVTAGFKRYSRRFLGALDLANIVSPGYAFQVEMIFQAVRQRFQVLEIPVTFVDRRVGQSKIAGELFRSAKAVWRLMLRRQGARQLIKFSIVGVINAGVDWGVFYLILLVTGWQIQPFKQAAKALSFVVSASSSYGANRLWTFRSKNPAIGRQLLQFIGVALVGLLINNTAFFVASAVFDWRDITGLVTATALSAFWNFSLNKYWTFRA